MRNINKLVVYAGALGLAISTASAATITGTVKGPDGKPQMGIFVVAEDAKAHRSVYVLSGEDGRYRIPDLPAATYDVKINAIGWQADTRSTVALKADAKPSFDFTLKTRPVAWSELTTYQGRMLLPHTPEHDLSHRDPFFATCWQSCHSFQNRMADKVLDKDGWRAMVQYMVDSMFAGEGRKLSEKEMDEFSGYLAVMFGPESPKPSSPQENPAYKNLVRTLGPKSMNIVYVEYDVPTPNGMGPWSAMEDRDGMMWIPYYGRGNAVVRLNPDTGEMTPFKLPFTKTAGIHSAIPSADGTVWFVENSLGKIAHLDPKTGKIEEIESPKTPDGKKPAHHTIRVDKAGRVWTSGGAVISRYDPKTKEWKYWDMRGTYANTVGLDGDQWFTAFRPDGPIVRISKDDHMQAWLPPTAQGKPQRLQLDAKGNVWFSERQGNKLAVLDPKTGDFKEFPLPGPEASPYALGIDRDGMIWYASHEQDTIGRFDPKTSETREYPYPHPEIAMREFELDSKGRMWYGASTNNKVGYFYYNDATAK
jgi:virginiamycin B lyase